jgi:hypothetical protein
MFMGRSGLFAALSMVAGVAAATRREPELDLEPDKRPIEDPPYHEPTSAVEVDTRARRRDGSRAPYTGEQLRELRSSRGCGRPPGKGRRRPAVDPEVVG